MYVAVGYMYISIPVFRRLGLIAPSSCAHRCPHAGVQLLRPRSAETTALGAAFAAGLGVGYWASLDELKQVYVSGKTWGPAMTSEERARQMGNWKKAVTRSMGWVDGKEAP
jgi:glycerol kinase